MSSLWSRPKCVIYTILAQKLSKLNDILAAKISLSFDNFCANIVLKFSNNLALIFTFTEEFNHSSDAFPFIEHEIVLAIVCDSKVFVNRTTKVGQSAVRNPDG